MHLSMSRLRIKKGYNIRIAGIPADDVKVVKNPTQVSIQPVSFRSVKPKLLVKEGDVVQIGAPLFFDKNMPSVKWASPGSGIISKIQYGPRRVVENIVIDLDNEDSSKSLPSYSSNDLSQLGRDKVLGQILDAHLFPFIRQRPFNKVANPDETPDAIFISGLNTAPLSVNLNCALSDRLTSFQAGVDVLGQLTEGKVFLNVSENSILSEIENCEKTIVTGPHPAGNVGIQIHHLSPLKPGKLIWTVDAQHVATLGDLFLTGAFNPAIVITVAGPSIQNPTHMVTRMGASVQSLVKDHLSDNNTRIISGDVLTGAQTSVDGFLGFYHTAITALPEIQKREFLGWLKPGSGSTRYTFTNTYFKDLKKPFDFNSGLNGGIRALVPIDAWENVLPMDIMPIALFKSILARDIEEMEQLGIIECDPEDFALCSFACPSKIELSSIIQSGLDIIEAEG